jgi:hypothetical protein
LGTEQPWYSGSRHIQEDATPICLPLPGIVGANRVEADRIVTETNAGLFRS